LTNIGENFTQIIERPVSPDNRSFFQRLLRATLLIVALNCAMASA
jgi:hypothetical protein